MIGVGILAAYIACVLLAAAAIVRHETSPYTDATERFMLGVLGLISGLFWPLAFPVMAVLWLSKRETRAQRRERLAIEKDTRVRELQAHIARLERELNIGQAAS